MIKIAKIITRVLKTVMLQKPKAKIERKLKHRIKLINLKNLESNHILYLHETTNEKMFGVAENATKNGRE